jgi:2-iminobutanoate/2-iminopropanoate deaminase
MAEHDKRIATISTTDAPAAVGPYAQAVRVGGTVWTSGQIGLDPGTGSMVDGGVEGQTQRVFDNLQAVLLAAGSSLDRVVKTMCFLADMNDFQAFNAIYASRFGTHRPARSTVQAARLPLDARVEIEVIALCDEA